MSCQDNASAQAGPAGGLNGVASDAKPVPEAVIAGHYAKHCPVPVDRLEALAAEHGTPFHLYSEARLRQRVRHMLESFRAAFPGFTNFFAAKATPNPAILRILLEEGCGLDVASAGELWIAKKLGVPGDKIIFTSNYTAPEHLSMAAEQGAILNLDDITQVDSLRQECERLQRPFPELISFRVNPGVGRSDSSVGSNVLGGPEAKFGVPRDQVLQAYQRAKAYGAKRFGIHMMTGSCVLDNGYWPEIVAILLDCMLEVFRETGVPFEFFNIGGGAGIPYCPLELPASADANNPGAAEEEKQQPQQQDAAASRFATSGEEIAESSGYYLRLGQLVDVLREVVEAKFPLLEQLWKQTYGDAPFKRPVLYMENGRYLTGPSGWLVSRARAEKQAFGQRYIGLDACMAHLMRPGMYGAYHHISVPGRATSGACGGDTAPVNVVGTLCENNDWFAKQRALPKEFAMGDLVVIHDTGAHGASMGFQYNSALRAPELLMVALPGDVEANTEDAKEAKLIRRRETPEDLFGNTIWQ